MSLDQLAELAWALDIEPHEFLERAQARGDGRLKVHAFQPAVPAAKLRTSRPARTAAHSDEFSSGYIFARVHRRAAKPRIVPTPWGATPIERRRAA